MVAYATVDGVLTTDTPGPDGWFRFWLTAQYDMTGGVQNDIRVKWTPPVVPTPTVVLIDGLSIMYFGTAALVIKPFLWQQGDFTFDLPISTTTLATGEWFTHYPHGCPVSRGTICGSLFGAGQQVGDVVQFMVHGRYAVTQVSPEPGPLPVELDGIKSIFRRV